MWKSRKKWLATLLGVSILSVSLSGNVMSAFAEDEIAAETSLEESAQDGSATEITTAASTETQDGLLENSWRYENGALIPQVEAYATSPDAWKKVNGVYLNSVGEPIVGAIKKGIDVSEYQKVIDWEQVKADGIDYAIIRCGYGDDYTRQDDKQWLRNVSECERLGIPYGVYIYSYAMNVEMAKSEAAHTLRLLKGHSPSYPVYYDLEEKSATSLGASTLGQIAKTFCDTVSAAGYSVGIYANLNWWTNYLTDPVFSNSSWSKWVAQYNTTCDYNGNYDMWQSTSGGKVKGIEGNTDLNFWFIPQNQFADVPAGSWYYDSVSYVYENGLMTGMSSGVFGPSMTTSRGQFVTILHRMAKSPQIAYSGTFPDVSEGQFYTMAALWAAEKGVVSGYDNGYFGPADEITREQMITMLYRYAKQMGLDVTAKTSLEKFPDNGQVGGFAKEAFQWAVSAGIISGNADGTLAPVNPADRAACATMIMRFNKWAKQ